MTTEAELGAKAAAELTLKEVETWALLPEPGHRGRVPFMPRPERVALAWLENEACIRKLTETEQPLYRALRRKLEYRAARDLVRV